MTTESRFHVSLQNSPPDHLDWDFETMAEIVDREMNTQTKSDKWRVYSQYGVPPDPHTWSIEETASWFLWLSDSCSLRNTFSSEVLRCGVDGPRLCMMTKQDFHNVFYECGDNPDVAFHHLQCWKTVPPFTPSDDPDPELLKCAIQKLSTSRFPRIHLDCDENRINQVFPKAVTDLDRHQRYYQHIYPGDNSTYINGSSDCFYDNTYCMEDIKPFTMAHQLDIPLDSTQVPRIKMEADYEPEELVESESDFSDDHGETVDNLMSPASPMALHEVPLKRRGRPPKPRTFQPKKQKKRHPILWKFLLDSLNDPAMSECLTWVNKEDGLFRFVSNNKEDIARKWGESKGNRKLMTYQKMARALRDYGKKGIIRKHRRRLHYIFFPKYISMDENSNFSELT
ncbi:transcriptional regulator Erg-like [Glandiceps talaboti]